MKKKLGNNVVKIKVPTFGNKLIEKLQKAINENDEVKSLWKIINVNAIDRRGMSDHGYVHFQIVANIALRISRILNKNKVKMSIVDDFGLSYEHSESVVFLASLFHDLGMTIDREGHEGFSLFLANRILMQILDFLPVEERMIVASEVLHAIISHRSGGKPKTIEAGIVRVADALDMGKGRSRIPYEAGYVDIYSVSAAAIDDIEIKEGKDRPVRIKITMNNSSGIFQVDELLKKKISGSGIQSFIEVKAYVRGNKEKKLVKELIVKE